MTNLDTFFDDMTAESAAAFLYSPLTGEQVQMSNIDDIIEWAEAVQGEWNGDEAGSQEDRAHCASEIITKLLEAKELIVGMSDL